MKKIFLFVLASGILAFAALLIRPATVTGEGVSREPILAGAHADPHVVALLERSCQNCHSLNTEWPYYGRIFPFSLAIEHDVRTARSHMNLSRWQMYEDSEKRRILSEIGSVVRNRIMPPARYTLLHPEAKLTESERNEIYRWTRADRKLLDNAKE